MVLILSPKSDRKWQNNGKNYNSTEKFIYVLFGC